MPQLAIESLAIIFCEGNGSQPARDIIIKTTDKYLKCNELLTGRASPIVNALRMEFDREYA